MFIIIKNVLIEVGSDLSKIVCVIYYLLDVKEFELCWLVLCEVFGDNLFVVIMIEVNLIDFKYWIEIEVIVLV